MIQAGLDIHYTFVDIWKTFVVVEKWIMKNEWCINRARKKPRPVVRDKKVFVPDKWLSPLNCPMGKDMDKLLVN